MHLEPYLALTLTPHRSFQSIPLASSTTIYLTLALTLALTITITIPITLNRGPDYLALSASFAPSPADLAASSWSISYSVLTITLILPLTRILMLARVLILSILGTFPIGRKFRVQAGADHALHGAN